MKRLFIILFSLASASSLSAQHLRRVTPESVGMSSKQLEYTDAVINNAIKDGQIPGAVLAVVRHGSMPYLKAYGNKSLFPTRQPMSEDTVFDMASCTKSLSTAISAMILVERGELALRDDLDLYFDNFNRNKKYNGESCAIKVKHLMTHTSGLRSYVYTSELEKVYNEVNRKNLIDFIKKTDRLGVPNTKFRYSCLNFILLQYIIEQLSGESLRDFAQKNIYTPLGMTSTDYIPLDKNGKRISEDYINRIGLNNIAPTERVGADSTICGIVHDPLAHDVNHGISGNAGLFSTAEDVAVLCAALLNGGEINGTRILSPQSVKTMRNVPKEADEFGRALGWDLQSAYNSNIGELFDYGAYGHAGFTGTSITLDPTSDVAIILLTNYRHMSKPNGKKMVRLRALVANTIAAAVIEE